MSDDIINTFNILMHDLHWDYQDWIVFRDLRDKMHKIIDENATLHEKLCSAVIIPCKVGDEVCRFFRATDDTIFIRSTTIKSITINKKGIRVEFTNQFYGGYIDDDFEFLTYDDLIKDKFIFVDATYYLCPRAAAEKRLAEIGVGK